jgi:hypothetical protein
MLLITQKDYNMAASLGAAIGGVTGLAKFADGSRMRRRAQRAIDNFEFQELTNAYEGVQVSTLGADLQREEAARLAATNIDALRAGGTRGVLAGTGRVAARQQQTAREIAANLDQQQRQIDLARAQDDVRIQQMIEQRQANELAGLGQQANVGMGLAYQGLGNISNAAFTIGQLQMRDQAINPQPNQGMTGMMGRGNQPYPTNIPMGSFQTNPAETASLGVGSYGLS